MKAFNKQKINFEKLQNGEYAVHIDHFDMQVSRNGVLVNGYESDRLDFTLRQLNSDTIIEAFVREKLTLSQEFALINAYNASISGISVNLDKEKEYKDFLTWREKMKADVKKILEDNKKFIDSEYMLEQVERVD